MNLEFIKNINGYDEHAIRLSDFDTAQAIRFRSVIESLIADEKTPVLLSSLDFIKPISCTLTLRVAGEDSGISIGDKRNCFCDLTIGAYRNILKLLEPFCRKESKGYQWLYDIDTPIGFLFSAGKDLPAV